MKSSKRTQSCYVGLLSMQRPARPMTKAKAVLPSLALACPPALVPAILARLGARMKLRPRCSTHATPECLALFARLATNLQSYYETLQLLRIQSHAYTQTYIAASASSAPAQRLPSNPLANGTRTDANPHTRSDSTARRPPPNHTRHAHPHHCGSPTRLHRMRIKRPGCCLPAPVAVQLLFFSSCRGPVCRVFQLSCPTLGYVGDMLCVIMSHASMSEKFCSRKSLSPAREVAGRDAKISILRLEDPHGWRLHRHTARGSDD